jgi:glutamate racemase
MQSNPAYPAPIGIFDSGVGGLSVLKAIRHLLPQQPAIFLADQAHVPYGARPSEEVRSFAEGITRFLLRQGCGLIVVACNTASAAALHSLRQTLPQVQFVGMEPAVKPAAETTHSGVVGVLATPATFQGALYASVIERFAQGVKVLQNTCPGLVTQIEAGALDGPETCRILTDALRPMLSQGIDTVVLGCTHYPFVIPLIQEIAGPGVRVIDPAPAVARQVQRLIEAGEQKVNPAPEHPSCKTTAPIQFLTSGEPLALQALLPLLLGEKGQVACVSWKRDAEIGDGLEDQGLYTTGSN